MGWLEPVVFPELGLQVVAKLDTGAKTSALDAEKLEVFERDGQKWARFGLRASKDGELHWLESRVLGERHIRAAVGRETRPLVALWTCVAGEKRRVLFTLTDRRHMNYRVLLGRRALEGRLLVDSGRHFVSEPGCSADEVEAFDPSELSPEDRDELESLLEEEGEAALQPPKQKTAGEVRKDVASEARTRDDATRPAGTKAPRETGKAPATGR